MTFSRKLRLFGSMVEGAAAGGAFCAISTASAPLFGGKLVLDTFWTGIGVATGAATGLGLELLREGTYNSIIDAAASEAGRKSVEEIKKFFSPAAPVQPAPADPVQPAPAAPVQPAPAAPVQPAPAAPENNILYRRF